MALLPLRFYGDSVLRQSAQAINKITPEIRKFAKDMIETMHNAEGVGLAAPQVGRSIQMITVNVGDERGDMVLINPKITFKTGKYTYQEGCLSLPGVFEDVERYGHIIVKARNLDGDTIEIEAKENLLAVCLQHEIDHLKGILFVDKIEDRLLANKNIAQLQKELNQGVWKAIPQKEITADSKKRI